MEDREVKRQKIEENDQDLAVKRKVLTPKERTRIYRERKNQYYDNLESENVKLKEQIRTLTKENKELNEKVKLLEENKLHEFSISGKTSAFTDIKSNNVCILIFYTKLSSLIIHFSKGDY